MIQIAKIIHKESLHNHNPLPYIRYQKLSDTDAPDRVMLPTLIVGWKLVNELLPQYPHDILEREIQLNRPDKYFWEFTPSEDIVQYSFGIELFIRKAPYLFLSKFEYKNADPFFNNLWSIDDVEKFLPAGGNLYIYRNEMAYYCHENVIYGIKLVIYEYIGIDILALISMLIGKSAKHHQDDGTEYQKLYKEFPEFGNLKRSMVVFLFP